MSLISHGNDLVLCFQVYNCIVRLFSRTRTEHFACMFCLFLCLISSVGHHGSNSGM